MFILNESNAIIKENIEEVSPLMEQRGIPLSREVDTSNPLVDLEPNYMDVEMTTYAVGVIIRMASGKEHQVYRLHTVDFVDAVDENGLDKKDDILARLQMDATEYVKQISTLVFPNRKIQHLKISKK